MTVESKLHITETSKEEIKFPILASLLDDSNSIVLFDTESSGTVIHAENDRFYKVGSYHDNFVSIKNKDIWEILPKGSTVEITQK